MKPFLLLLLSGLYLLSATGCPRRAAYKGPDTAPAALDTAIAALEEGRYGKAEEAFNWVIFNFPGSREASDAQYWLAESYFRRGSYPESRTEYEFYIRSFPHGRYREDAYYKLGLAWLRSAPAGARDRTPLLKAEEALSDFLLLYPDSDIRPEVEASLAEAQRRRIERDFDVARLYYRAGEYRSARVYFRYIADKLPPERWEPTDRLRFAHCLYRTGEPDEARELLVALIADPDSDHVRQQARRLLDQLE